MLGDHKIQEQGSWQDIKSKAGLIIKFEPDAQRLKISPNYDKLGAQLQATEEAEVDLCRQTGDIALYGTHLL